jgi:aryl-alcohol dehydrogenase-like predicted oxidoreductase
MGGHRAWSRGGFTHSARTAERIVGERNCDPRLQRSILVMPMPASALSGFATREGTARFASRLPQTAYPAFYREGRDLLISSIGIGTYLGAMNDATDAAYAEAIHEALQRGVNVIDTSLNYRHQRSERAVAAGIRAFVQHDQGGRNEFLVCTKGGYLVPGAMTENTLTPDEVAGGMHSMALAFLADQIDRSRRNLGLETIDVYYLHNPETQLEFVDLPEFMKRIQGAFDRLERAVADGLIRYYGTATWDGYRRAGHGALSLPALAEAAHQIAGDNHHFRFIQLPFNPAMPEALTRPVEGGGTVLDVAAQLDITVVASAPLMQARLARNLPSDFERMLPGLGTDAQRAIQFTRSTPGIASALVGMSNRAHVEENLAVARIDPLTSVEYQRFVAAR